MQILVWLTDRSLQGFSCFMVETLVKSMRGCETWKKLTFGMLPPMNRWKNQVKSKLSKKNASKKLMKKIESTLWITIKNFLSRMGYNLLIVSCQKKIIKLRVPDSYFLIRHWTLFIKRSHEKFGKYLGSPLHKG